MKLFIDRLQPRAASTLSPDGELIWTRLERVQLETAESLNSDGELIWKTQPMDSKIRRFLFAYRGEFAEQWMYLCAYNAGMDYFIEEKGGR